MRYLIITFFLFYSNHLLYSQTLTVYSKNENIPLENVHVAYKDLISGKEDLALTDSLGSVFLEINDSSSVYVSISYMGYIKHKDTLTFFKKKKVFLTEDNVALNEVVITAQFAPNNPEKAVHKIKIIDQKKIKAMGAQNLRDVLTNEMNVRISQDNVLGSSMSLQGVSGQNVKILIDGVAVNGRLNGNIDVSQINMNNVERIEIIEGPLSVNYGTDALAGTINIISKKNQKKSIEISNTSYYESSGNYNTSGRIGYRKNKSILTLSGGRNYFDGWRADEKPFKIEKEQLADTSRTKDWNPKEQLFTTFYYGRYFKNLKLGFTSDYFHEQIMNRGLPRLPYYEYAFDDYYTTKRFNNSINLTGQLTKNKYLNVIFAYNHFTRKKNTYYKDLTTLYQKLSENSTDQDTSNFNNITLRGSYSTTKDSTKINYEIGYDINYEIGKGIRIEDGSKQIGDYAIFSSAEYNPFSRLIVRPGVRLIYNTTYKAPIVPSINMRYELSENTTYRFSYAKGFRAPSIKELYFFFVDINHNIVGNSNLKAENSNNFNFSINYNKKIKNNILWKIDNSYFYNQMENMISLAQISGVQYTYFNIDKFQTLGIQLHSEVAWQHFKFTIGGSYVGRYNQLSVHFPSEKFTYTPEGRCNLFYKWQRRNMTIALFYKYTGALPSFTLNENNELYRTKINAYNTADLSITKSFLKKKINISIGSKNLFNVVNVVGNSISSGAHSEGTNSVSVGVGRTYFFKLDMNLESKK